MNPDIDPLREQPPEPDDDDDDADQADDADETGDPTTDDLVDAAIDYESQQRLWLRAIVPLLNLRSAETDPSGRVQLALDLMMIAACERVGRIMRGDLAGDRAESLMDSR